MRAAVLEVVAILAAGGEFGASAIGIAEEAHAAVVGGRQEAEVGRDLQVVREALDRRVALHSDSSVERFAAVIAIQAGLDFERDVGVRLEAQTAVGCSALVTIDVGIAVFRSRPELESHEERAVLDLELHVDTAGVVGPRGAAVRLFALEADRSGEEVTLDTRLEAVQAVADVGEDLVLSRRGVGLRGLRLLVVGRLVVRVGLLAAGRRLGAEVDAGPGVRVLLSVGRFRFEREAEFADWRSGEDDVGDFPGSQHLGRRDPAGGRFAHHQLFRLPLNVELQDDLFPSVGLGGVGDPGDVEFRRELLFSRRNGLRGQEDRGSRDGRRSDLLHLLSFSFLLPLRVPVS